MDLRNLSSTPNQLDPMQRRTSISSLSSASGYSSTYGTATPQLSNQRINQARMTSNAASNNPGAVSGTGITLINSVSSSSGVPGSTPIQQQWLNQSQLNNVGPWVEQQQQQQQQQPQQHDELVVVDSSNPASNGAGEALSDDADADDDGEVGSDDELIPTAIVIKNIPFAIKKEQLLDVMTKLNLPLPYAFNYHFDNGVFRGLAFANFTLTNETSQVVNLLNGREIGGRKLRVEYKKMLPLKERERIEREKREKRGQLEEQHRSNSTASLALLISTASTTAATKNLSVNGTGTLQQPTERLFVSFPQQLPNNILLQPPIEINFNEPEILELYTQLVSYRDDITKATFELAFLSLSIPQRKILSILANFLNLLEFYDNGLIIIRRKPGQTLVSRQNLISSPSFHSSSLMNLNQFGSVNSGTTIPELLRTNSQNAIPLSAPPNRPMHSTSTPIQLQFPQYQTNPNSNPNPRYGGWQSQGQVSQTNATGQTNGFQHSPQPQHASLVHHTPQTTGGQNIALLASTPTSAAALLRSSNNRSFVDVRATQAFNGESPTPSHHYFSQNAISQVSQPGTPLASTTDINSRFAPFGQHSGSYSTLQPPHTQHQQQPSTPQHEEYDSIHQKFNGLKLAHNYEPSNPTQNLNSNAANNNHSHNHSHNHNTNNNSSASTGNNSGNTANASSSSNTNNKNTSSNANSANGIWGPK